MIDAEQRKIIESLADSETLKDVLVSQTDNSIRRHKILTIIRNAIEALEELLPFIVKKPFILLIVNIILDKLKKTLKELKDD
jgi:hypothetical protein